MSSTSTHAPAPGQPVSAPEDFPVSWAYPDDAKLTWQRDTHIRTYRTAGLFGRRGSYRGIQSCARAAWRVNRLSHQIFQRIHLCRGHADRRAA